MFTYMQRLYIAVVINFTYVDMPIEGVFIYLNRVI